MKRVIRSSTNPQVTERETANRQLARRICSEGIVLLANDGTLPIENGRVALYGLGARYTVSGGTGSGEARPRQIVNIEQGLINAGVEIASKAWLDEYDELYKKEHRRWREEFERGIKSAPVRERMGYANLHPFHIPAGRGISAEDSLAAGCSTAIYVLTRQAGEGADRRLTPGDWQLTEAEISHITDLCTHFEHTALVINSGGLIDLSPLDELKLGAVVYFAQGGMEGGNGLADVLTGKVSPSGRLTDTWAYRYEDYPSHDTFSFINGDTDNEDYREGIYVGYRYFDTFGVKPRYAFGHGLSYTQFALSNIAVSLNGGKVNISTAVTNTGDKYSGRQVVQVYVSSPSGRLDREYQSLAAYAKTSTLAPGQSCAMEISFDIADIAAFCEEDSAYILEPGDYIVRVGTASDRTSPAAVIRIAQQITTRRVKHICPLERKFDRLTPPERKAEVFVAPVIELDCRSIVCEEIAYTPKDTLSDEAKKIVSRLSLKQMATLVVGGGFIGPSYNTTFGAVGRTTSKLLRKGIQNLNMADGPQGLNLAPRAVKPRQNFYAMPVIPEGMRFGMLGRIADKADPKPNTRRKVYYQYCTAWPCETVVAQTWDTDLARSLGEGTALEMVETGVAVWLAPGMNIHRNVLCGRNFEYYSEDPVLTGITAAAVISGAQSQRGCFATPKHFACNNQEDNRQGVSSNVDERTLREIYLKGFEIMVRRSAPRALMSSYNKINGVYAPNNRDLLTDTLRCEWGFDGVVMTDWTSTGFGFGKHELAIASGNDLIMPGFASATKDILRAVRRKEISRDDLILSATRITQLILDSRMYDGAKK